MRALPQDDSLAEAAPLAPAPLMPAHQRTITPPGQVVRSIIWGEPIFFTVVNPRDVIQRHHLQGAFYEPEELEIIRQHCPPGAVFCDIGANVGNHALYVLKYLRPSSVVVFEPNPEAIALLKSNLELNGVIDRCDISRLGVGLSDVESENMGLVTHDRNLGAARMVETDGDGGLTVRTGDALLQGIAPTFLKIDVEGMEIQVLAGLAKTIAAHRPTIFIEVDRVNDAAFKAWVATSGYAIRATFKRYRTNENYLLVAV
jgi:FkbM family methyltransferase